MNNEHIIENIIGNMYPEYKSMNKEEQDDFWDDLSSKEHYIINREILKQTGNPKYDYLKCFEPGRFNNDDELFTFDSFKEIDVSWWEFQRDESLKSIEDIKKWASEENARWTMDDYNRSLASWKEKYKEYSIYCTGDWYRLMDGDVFKYAEIIAARWYIFYQLETYIDEIQESKIPYDYNDDLDIEIMLNANDPVKKYKANGREKELNVLLDKINNYTQNNIFDLIDNELAKNSHLSGATFIIDDGYDDDSDNFDPFTNYILFDIKSLENVKPKSFLSDVKNHQVSTIKLESIISNIKKMVYNDIIKIYEKNKKIFD